MLTRKRIVIIVVSIIIVLISAVAVAMALSTSQKDEKTTPSATTSQLAAKETVERIVALKQPAIKDITFTSVKANDKSGGTYVRSDDLNAYIYVPSDQSTTANRPTPYSKEALVALDNAVTELLTAEGYSTVDKQLPSGSIKLLQNGTTVCHMQGIVGSSTVRIDCSDEKVYGDYIKTINEIVASWNDLPSFDFVVPSIATSDDGKYSLASLRTFTADGTITGLPIFKMESGKGWQFVTDSLGNAGANSNGKVSTQGTEALRQDEHYRPLLEKM